MPFDAPKDDREDRPDDPFFMLLWQILGRPPTDADYQQFMDSIAAKLKELHP
ncbi:hypothetical protein [Primorskyibacter sp. S87]|uniref:hypothetical protein n=1 Tax=Primorskyibacter sp. S87 TaxID=3415126 RepID=UPI003C7E7DFA